MKPIIDARWKWIWGAVLAFAWTSVVVLFVKSNGNLSVQELLNYQPESTLLALLTMAGLFLLKSVDFLMHSGVLYAANGIMFPPPVALLLNTNIMPGGIFLGTLLERIICQAAEL